MTLAFNDWGYWFAPFQSDRTPHIFLLALSNVHRKMYDESILFELCCNYNCASWEGALQAVEAASHGNEEVLRNLSVHALYSYATAPPPTIRQHILKLGNLVIPDSVQDLPPKLDGASHTQQLEVLCSLEQHLQLSALDREGPAGGLVGPPLDILGGEADQISDLLLRNSLLYEENIALKEQLSTRQERHHVQHLDAVHDSLVQQLYTNLASMQKAEETEKKLQRALRDAEHNLPAPAVAPTQGPKASTPTTSVVTQEMFEELKQLHQQTVSQLRGELQKMSAELKAEQQKRLEAAKRVQAAEAISIELRQQVSQMEKVTREAQFERDNARNKLNLLQKVKSFGEQEVQTETEAAALPSLAPAPTELEPAMSLTYDFSGALSPSTDGTLASPSKAEDLKQQNELLRRRLIQAMNLLKSIHDSKETQKGAAATTPGSPRGSKVPQATTTPPNSTSNSARTAR